MLFTAQNTKQFLMEELARRQQINSRYSQRAFAKHLGLSPGEMSEVLSGKRRLSLKSALKIGRVLGLNPAEMKHLLSLCQIEKSAELGMLDFIEPTNNPALTQNLSLDMFRIVSDWYCFSILSLMDCQDYKWQPQWFSKRLGINVQEAQVAMDRLLRVGLVIRKNGGFAVSNEQIVTASGIPSEAVRNYHKQILEKGIKALEFQRLSEREISGLGFAIDPKHIEAVRKEINEFQEKIAAKYSKGKKTEVYQLEVAFFRISEGNTDGKI